METYKDFTKTLDKHIDYLTDTYNDACCELKEANDEIEKLRKEIEDLERENVYLTEENKKLSEDYSTLSEEYERWMNLKENRGINVSISTGVC